MQPRRDGGLAATQNQALNALVFLYGEVLHQPLGELGDYLRVRRPARLPEVLSREEVARVVRDHMFHPGGGQSPAHHRENDFQ